MANIKFSQFTQKTTLGTVDFLVGYTGADNVQIDPADLLSDYSQGTGAAGQVTFFSATSTVTGDNDFYWDNTNKRLGIGTTTPETKAHIKMSGGSAQLTLERTGGGAGKVVLAGAAEGLIVYNDSFASKMYVGTSGSYDGKVGIGTITPASTLDVNGTLIATGISQLGSGGANVYLTSSSAGSVGIGTSSPAKKLHVRGSAPWIRIEEDSVSNKRLDLYVNPSTAIGVIAANQSAQQLSFQTSNTDRLRITNAGNVGIGTTSPSTKLEVNGTVHLGSGGNDVTIGASNSSVIFMIRAGYNYIQASDASGAIMFRTGGGNNRMIIDSSGNVGIGTTSPAQKLDVFGAIRVNSDGDRKIDFLRTNGNHFSIEHDTSQIYFYNHTTSEIPILMQNDGDVIMNAGNVGIGTASPTSKLTVAGEITASAANATLNLLSETNGNSTINFADPADNNVGQIIYRHNGNSMSFDTNDLERMRIDSSGNVGIGTTSPGAKLTVSDSTDNAAELRVLRANSSSSTYASVGTVGGTGLFKSSGDVRLQATGAANLSLNTNGSDRIRIDSAGNVGIGTTSPGTKLHVAGTVRITGTNDVDIYSDSTGVRFDLNSSVRGFQFENNNGALMYISASGNVGIGTTSPEDYDVSDNPILAVGNTATTNYSSQISVLSGSSGFGYLLFGDGETGNEAYRGQVRYNHTNDSLEFVSAGSERMRIDSAGNVGIGTTSIGTNDKLLIKTSVDNSVAQGLVIQRSANTDEGYINYNGGGFQFRSTDGDPIVFGQVSNERMRIDSAGNVLVGTTSAISTGNGLSINSTGQMRIGRASTGFVKQIIFSNPNNEVGSISTSGSATAFNTSSDYRLKKDLKDFDGLDKVSKIPVYDFKWKVDDSRSYGVMAHELQEVLPDAVSGEKDAEEMQGVDYSKIVPLLIKSIQELEAKVKELESK
jgi:hypothetical protein